MDTSGNLSAFLDGARKALGTAHVIAEDPEIERRSRDPVFTSCPPEAFLYPASTEEVQAVMRLANRHRVTVWPYSTGKNWGYGNTALKPGAVVMILNLMNRIHRVDEELAYAVLEPGVTYEQLNAHLKTHGIKLWPDSTGGPPSGSVIGNALDRGIGATPKGDHFGNLCGLEVVLPDGEIVRTGGFGKMEGAWHTYKWGIGPSWEGMFAQSNLGTVTKAGIWLMPEPEDFVTAGFRVETDDDLVAAMNEVRKLMFRGVIPDKARFTNDVAMLTMITQVIHEDVEKEAFLTPDDLQRLKEKYCVPRWAASFALYGPKAQVRVMRKEVKRRLRPLARVVMVGPPLARWLERALPFVTRQKGRLRAVIEALLRAVFRTSSAVVSLVPQMVALHQGIPGETVVRRAYFRAKQDRPVRDIDVARDQIGALWFVPLAPFRGQEVVAYQRSCREEFARHRMEFYMTIMVLNERTTVPLMLILYRKEEADECRRALELYEALYRDALARGYQQFRCGLPGWDLIYSGCPELQGLNEKIKQVLDPNNILAPGRYGIGCPVEGGDGSS